MTEAQANPPLPTMLPTIDDVRAAAARIAPHAVVTPQMRSDALDDRVGARVLFKCEHLQRGGAFKFRGACNAVWSLPEDASPAGVITHSSGNHGTALALAAATRGVRAQVVVPEGAVRFKLEAIAAAGAQIHRCAATQAARETMAAELAERSGAALIHPYIDPHVIAGQGTVALELLNVSDAPDALIAPVGGGGLIGGCALAAHALAPQICLFAAEPEGADDAWRSLERGERVGNDAPATICDGLRASIGAPNFSLMHAHKVQVLRVSDAEVIAAMRLIWQHLKQVVEPSSATVLAALLRYPQQFRGMRVAAILTGGNVDLDALPWAAT